jgi:hypothetical protein
MAMSGKCTVTISRLSVDKLGMKLCDRENATLAVNHLNDSFSASAALADRELYLRGEKFLYCIAEE